MSRLHAAALLLTGTGLSLVPAAARADDATCGDAFEQSQARRDDGKLLEARKLFRICGRPTCSSTEQRLCAEWLRDVERNIPSFVFGATDAAGVDLVDVTVKMDGVEVATTLNGRTVDVDPGPHKVVFSLPDGTTAETTAVGVEHRKGKLVTVTLARPGSLPATPVVVPVIPGSPSTGAPPRPVAPPQPPPSASERGWSPMKTAGVAAGGAGVVGVFLGAVFGAAALSTKSDHCVDDRCKGGAASTALAQGNVSTALFIAGGALLAGGAALFVLAPSRHARPLESAAPTAGLAPLVGPGAGGLELGGTW